MQTDLILSYNAVFNLLFLPVLNICLTGIATVFSKLNLAYTVWDPLNNYH